ncbi:signal recognition particle 9 kDa protein-domain-containing protein [Bombardia bombarda]|uniref:Signal recognition particle 9 kDa protein-domain-containing protein n=1 Tax=Bombardia bombarda TaxID=252184 RepID=A0AA39XNI7_9PEZI|nr:signal recognition particle 9 kDa protein-domain-containing protein [Bombardia bombarda]
MPYYEKSEDWLTQSALLLSARPETVCHPHHNKIPPQARPPAHQGREGSRQGRRRHRHRRRPTTPIIHHIRSSDKTPRGHLVLKTFDPQSGVALKYKTSKAAEVSRLVQMLGTLARRMAALPEIKSEEAAEGAAMDVDAAAASGSGVQTPVQGGGPAPAAASAQQPAAGGTAGGKGKKKKGKR